MSRFDSAYIKPCRLILDLAPSPSAQDARKNAGRFSRQQLKLGPVWAYGHRYGPSLKTPASPTTASEDAGPFGVIFQLERGAADHVPI